MDELNPGSPSELQAVRLLADYLYNKQKRESIIQNLETKLTSGVDSNNDLFLLMAASVYYHEQASCIKLIEYIILCTTEI